MKLIERIANVVFMAVILLLVGWLGYKAPSLDAKLVMVAGGVVIVAMFAGDWETVMR